MGLRALWKAPEWGFKLLALAYAVTVPGHPALSLPVGVDRLGMPFGLQIVGPRGGDVPIRLGIFSGVHGDEPEGALALTRLVAALEKNPELAKGYCLFLYPVCNPTGFEDNTRHSRSGSPLGSAVST